MRKLPVFIAIMAVLLAACATPPTEEMDKAHDAVMRAENDNDAVTYAGDTLTRARDALTRMQAEADAKRYDAAKNYASEAVNLAESAITDGRAGAARAKEEAANLLNSLQVPLAETASALDNAQQNDMKLDYSLLSGDMDRANHTYSDARQSLESDNYPDATAKGQEVRGLLSAINASLSDAAHMSMRKQ